MWSWGTRDDIYQDSAFTPYAHTTVMQDMYSVSISEMLTVQYRMNVDIMQWSSDELYKV